MFRASDCVLTGVHHLLGRSANPVEYMVGQISELPLATGIDTLFTAPTERTPSRGSASKGERKFAIDTW
jgi:hypothetical protein